MSAPNPRRTLIVAAASRHGGTDGIANRLTRTLQAELSPGWRVVRSDLSDLQVFDDADAVVLGSAIYFGRWLRPAARALDYLKDAPVSGLWLFSSGPVSERKAENARLISAGSLVESGHAAGHRVFAGRLDLSGLTRLERIVVKAIHAPPGDHRDWDQIDGWAHQIGEELRAARTRGDGTNGSS